MQLKLIRILSYSSKSPLLSLLLAILLSFLFSNNANLLLESGPCFSDSPYVEIVNYIKANPTLLEHLNNVQLDPLDRLKLDHLMDKYNDIGFRNAELIVKFEKATIQCTYYDFGANRSQFFIDKLISFLLPRNS